MRTITHTAWICTYYGQLQVGENYWYMRPTSFQSYISNFSPTWSCVSLPRPTTLSGWKLLIYEVYLIPVIYQWFFTHLKLCLATETHNFKLVKITDIWGLPHSSHISVICHPLKSCVSLPRPTTSSGWDLLIYEAYLIPVTILPVGARFITTVSGL